MHLTLEKARVENMNEGMNEQTSEHCNAQMSEGIHDETNEHMNEQRAWRCLDAATSS